MESNKPRPKIVPLASIDEDCDDDADGDHNAPTITVVGPKLIRNYSLSFLKNPYQQFNFASPMSDDTGSLLPTPTTPAAVIYNHHHYTSMIGGESVTNDDLNDTGFFTSSSMSSSKRSSMDLGDSFNNTASMAATICSSQQHSQSFRVISDFKNGDEEVEDELDEVEQLLAGDDPPSVTVMVTEERKQKMVKNSISGSLEDLVNSFDEKVKNCLKNYDENVSKLAPVPVRSQEEVLKNRPAWWTLTGNYGNLLPIDWEKLSPEAVGQSNFVSEREEEQIMEEEEETEDSKLAALIDSCLELSQEVKSADQVLQEIDEIIRQSQSSSRSSSISAFDLQLPRSTFYRFSLDKLKTFTVDQLQDLREDLEGKTVSHSQTLIGRLAERDELEFERQIKNNFLALLVKIQKRRKEYFRRQQLSLEGDSGTVRKRRRYLTTVIPYRKDSLATNLEMLQALVKILRAILDDSPAVPTMLTDYILRFICPADTDVDLNNNNTTTNINSILKSRPKSSPTNQRITDGGDGFLAQTIRVARRSLSFNAKKTGTETTDDVANNNNDGEATGSMFRRLRPSSTTVVMA